MYSEIIRDLKNNPLKENDMIILSTRVRSRNLVLQEEYNAEIINSQNWDALS